MENYSLNEQKPLYPNMTLYVSPWTEDAETVNLLCVLNEIRPNKIKVKWEAITGTTSENVHTDRKFMVPKSGDEKGATFISLLSLEKEKWSSGINYKCQATDKSLSNSRNISFCSAYPSSSSSMYLEKLTLKRENQTHIAADCTAVGPYGTTLSLLVDGYLASSTKVLAGSGPKKITCNLSYPSGKWRKSVKITCKAEHQCYNPLEKTINIPNSTEPTVKLFLVPKEHARFRTLLCLGTGVNPQIKWLKGSVVKEVLGTMMQNDGQLTISSEINVQREDWNKGEIFTCQVEDQPAGVAVHQNISKCTETPRSSQTATVSIVGPSLKEKLGSGALQVTCHVLAYEDETFSIKWKMNCSVCSDQTTKKDNGNGTQTLTSVLSVSRQDWEKKPGISCQVKHACSSSIQEKQLEQTKDSKQPTLQIIRPSQGQPEKQHNATLLCLILDFFPADIDVYWELNGIQQPQSHYFNSRILGVSGRGDDGGYSMHSRLQIPQSDWNDGLYTCVVKHESSKKPLKLTISNKIGEHTVKVFFLVPKEHAGSRTLLCLGTGVNPQIKWLKGSVVQQAKVTMMQNDGQLTISSEMNVQKEEWNKGEIFTCQIEDQPAGVAVHQNISKCTETPRSSQTATVSIVGPSLKEKLGSGALQVTCHVLAYEDETFSIKWKMNCSVCSDQTTKKDNGNGTQTLTSVLSVSRQDWEKKPGISCQVKHACSSSIQEKQLEQTKDPKKPTLQIIRSSKGQLDKQRVATLLCLILDFFPADIDVYWELNGIQLHQSEYFNSHILGDAGRGDDGGYSMHSRLQIPQSGWSGAQYSCVVKHESSKEPLKLTIGDVFAVLNTNEVTKEDDENINNISNDAAQEDNLTEIWNTALTFIILFLISVVYSMCVTFVKVK